MYKKEYFKFKTWLLRKVENAGKLLALVCSESHLINVLMNSWQIEPDPYNQFLIGIRNKRKASRGLFVRNRNEVKDEWIGEIYLQIEYDFPLKLTNVIFVPSMRKWISFHRHDRLGFACSFGKEMFILCCQSNAMGFGFVSGGLYIT